MSSTSWVAINSILDDDHNNQLHYFHIEDSLMQSSLEWCIISSTTEKMAELGFKVEE